MDYATDTDIEEAIKSETGVQPEVLNKPAEALIEKDFYEMQATCINCGYTFIAKIKKGMSVEDHQEVCFYCGKKSYLHKIAFRYERVR